MKRLVPIEDNLKTISLTENNLSIISCPKSPASHNWCGVFDKKMQTTGIPLRPHEFCCARLVSR